MADVLATHATFVRVSLDAGTAQTHQLLHATATPEYARDFRHWMQTGEHRALAGKSGTNCNDCHTQSYCNDCHTGGGVDVERTADVGPAARELRVAACHLEAVLAGDRSAEGD